MYEMIFFLLAVKVRPAFRTLCETEYHSQDLLDYLLCTMTISVTRLASENLITFLDKLYRSHYLQ